MSIRVRGTAMRKAQAFPDKMRELILYVSRRSEDDPKFGATKLNKILFFSDFLAYRQYGQAITNQPYFRLEWGPAPKCLVPLRVRMIKDGDLALQTRDYYGEKQDRTVALREPDLAHFKGIEVAIVDHVIERLRDLDAGEASELSHRFTGWKLAGHKENIPYYVALLDSLPLVELPDTAKRHGLALEARARELTTA